MDSIEARDHIEMVDRILATAREPKPVRPCARLLIVMGLAAALIEGGSQLGRDGHGYAVSYAGAGLMVLAYLYLAWVIVNSRRKAARLPRSEVAAGRSFGAVWTGIAVASFAQPYIFTGWAAGAIWNLGGAIQMLMAGFQGDRRATIAGCVLLASIVRANYAPPIAGYILAAGFIFGYAVPGIAFIVSKDDCEACG